jgi:hypothetical protein
LIEVQYALIRKDKSTEKETISMRYTPPTILTTVPAISAITSTAKGSSPFPDSDGDGTLRTPISGYEADE